MNEKLAIEILKQASLETTTGACENCPRKDKNKTCIGCLDDAKDILLNHIDNLQFKIDKAIEILNDGLKQLDERNRCEVYSEEYLENARDILKEDK